jgi:hypothetical protein
LRKNIVADGVGFNQRPGTVELFNDLSIPCRVAEIKEEKAKEVNSPQRTQGTQRKERVAGELFSIECHK